MSKSDRAFCNYCLGDNEALLQLIDNIIPPEVVAAFGVMAFVEEKKQDCKMTNDVVPRRML